MRLPFTPSVAQTWSTGGLSMFATRCAATVSAGTGRKCAGTHSGCAPKSFCISSSPKRLSLCLPSKSEGRTNVKVSKPIMSRPSSNCPLRRL